jgi:outer membrane cobalamin receptor
VAAGSVTPRKGALTADGTPPANEKRVNLDIGVIRKCEELGTLTVTLFHVSRIDAIDYSGETVVTDSGQVVELYKNTDKRSYGMEGEMRRTILPGRWEVFANILLMRGEEKDSVWKKDDEIPVFIGNAGTSLHLERFDASFFMNYTGPFRNDRFVSKVYLREHGKAPLGDFFDLSLTTGYTVGRKAQIRFFGEIHNLLDRHYQTVPGWPDNGRIIRGGMKVKF